MNIVKSETHYVDGMVLEKILSSEKGHHVIRLKDNDDKYLITLQDYEKASELYESLDLSNINQAIERFQGFKEDNKYSKLFADLKQAEEKKQFILMVNVQELEGSIAYNNCINFWDNSYWSEDGFKIDDIQEYLSDYNKISGYKIIFWDDMNKL